MRRHSLNRVTLSYLIYVSVRVNLTTLTYKYVTHMRNLFLRNTSIWYNTGVILTLLRTYDVTMTLILTFNPWVALSLYSV